MTNEPIPPRRRFRYSLRTMFVLMTVAALVLGWFAHFLAWKREYDVPPPDMTVTEQPLLQTIGFRYLLPETLSVSASNFVQYSSHPDLERFLSENQSVRIMVTGDLGDYEVASDSIIEFRRRHPNIECGFPVID